MIWKNKEGQIRGGWKIGINFLAAQLMMIIVMTVLTIVWVIYKAQSGSFEGTIDTSMLAQNTYYFYGSIILQNVIVIGVTWALWKLLDKKNLEDLGLPKLNKESINNLLFGLLLGIFSMILVYGVLLLSGQIEAARGITEGKLTNELWYGLLAFIFVGVGEEIFSRGYCFQVLSKSRYRAVPVVGSSIIFALLHSFNSHMSLLSYINLFLVGLLFAWMVVRSKSIWLPIGYHITWNWLQGNVLGFPVSGNDANGVYVTNLTPQSNSWITGGMFGPEGGIVVTLVILLGFVMIELAYNYRYYVHTKESA